MNDILTINLNETFYQLTSAAYYLSDFTKLTIKHAFRSKYKRRNYVKYNTYFRKISHKYQMLRIFMNRLP